jgi:hypothetical protein
MKIRIIKLTPEFITELMQGKLSSFISNLPDDTELLDIKYDLFSRQVTAIVRSDSFEDVAENVPIPEFNAVYTNISKAKSWLKVKSEPTLKQAEKIPLPTSNEIRAIQKEFTEEQRRLLSFRIDGETVIIKPNQQLNDEWAEINAVVRSIGGRWVKGDVFSYWSIPLQKT